jgi:spermidine/putrescine transport system permease protein
MDRLLTRQDQHPRSRASTQPNAVTFARFVWGAAPRVTPAQINGIGSVMFKVAPLAVAVETLISSRRAKAVP